MGRPPKRCVDPHSRVLIGQNGVESDGGGLYSEKNYIRVRTDAIKTLYEVCAI